MKECYEVRVDERIVKQLRRFRGDVSQRIIAAIESLSRNPRPQGSLKLSGQPGWRIRVGEYRILYEIDDSAKEVTVYHVGHRRDVYR